MTVVLGIDTGGTYTDAVLVNYENDKILSNFKSLTTKKDLSIGIRNAIASVLSVNGKAFSPQKIRLVGLSTTLATNAIAEGHGTPVCLLLIGYDRDLIHQYRFQNDLGTQNVVYLNGGHDMQGNEQQPLDEVAAKQAILKWRESVNAFAVSGYFGVCNPDHEIRVLNLIDELTGFPSTCGHELSTRFNAIKRATTAALNARLIPIIQDLIFKVHKTLRELAISAPLMVVKGDGSLVRDEWAMKRPIETVLSGPAASALSAFKLAGKQNTWAVDVGGTTTDIVELVKGTPALNPEGAKIAGWRTMVEAVDVHTIGLGGDSHVRCNLKNELEIGPKRAVPLCKLANEYPDVVTAQLHQNSETQKSRHESDQFLILGKNTDRRLSEKDEAVLAQLNNGPQSLVMLINRFVDHDPWISQRIQRLEEIGVIQRAGFTPTDALHVLNEYHEWDQQASLRAATRLSALFGLSIDAFCKWVIHTVSKRIAGAIITKAASDEIGSPRWDQEPTASYLLEKALDQDSNGKLISNIRLNRPIVAIGAPVAAYMPRTADILQTDLTIPKFAGVANAVGAIIGNTVQRLRVRIQPISGSQSVRFLSPDGPKEFPGIEEAVRYARQHVTPQAEAKALKAGAKQVEIQIERKDKIVKEKGKNDIYLGTELIFIAFGRPGIDSPNIS